MIWNGGRKGWSNRKCKTKKKAEAITLVYCGLQLMQRLFNMQDTEDTLSQEENLSTFASRKACDSLDKTCNEIERWAVFPIDIYLREIKIK